MHSLHVDRKGQHYYTTASQRDPRSDEECRSQGMHDNSQTLFGSWSDLDADELIANIHRWRREGLRPATRP